MGPTPEGEAFLVLDNEDSFGFSMGQVDGGHRQVLFAESGPTGLFDESGIPFEWLQSCAKCTETWRRF